MLNSLSAPPFLPAPAQSIPCKQPSPTTKVEETSQQNHRTVPTYCPAVSIAAYNARVETHIEVNVRSQPQELKALMLLCQQQIQQLRVKKNYCFYFDRFIEGLVKLSDESLDLNIALSYTKRLHNVLTQLLICPDLYQRCMVAIQKNKDQLSKPLAGHFIHSQALIMLLNLELAASLNAPVLPPCYQQVVALHRRLVTWVAVWEFLNQYIETLEILPGNKSQLMISFLSAAQNQLDLPFSIIPIDEPADCSEEVLQAAIQYADKNTRVFLKRGQKLFNAPFWTTYFREGYKQDAAVRGTPLEIACKRIDMMKSIDPNTAVWWHKNRDKNPWHARRQAIHAVLKQGIKKTLHLT
jgi:hypothetical protein